MKKVSWVPIVVIAMILGFFVGRSSENAPADKKPMYWVDTMEPNIHYPGPGQSRMGMKLVPVYPDSEQAEDRSTIKISPTIVNNLGVRTAPVTQGQLARRIETVGYIEPNENKISHIHTYADGWIRKLFVKAAGEVVKENQVILQLYSPTLINVQDEYLIALGSGNQTLIDASYKRLKSFHISEQQIQQLKRTGKSNQLIDICPHQNGVITMLNVREGMHVTPETEIMSIVDLSNIWMIAQIYEDQANWVKVGELTEAKLSAFPGKVWKGEVEYIYPQVDPTTRTLKVRFHFDNPQGILKPNMYANIIIFAEPKNNVLSIPLEALIRSSEGDRVIVAVGDKFQVRAVVAGIESGEQVEILSGLKAGEKVVASGQFLIDSESSLNAGLQRMGNSSTSSQNSQASPNIIIQGDGIIQALDASQHSITLQHQPIPALSWQSMTMNFSVANNIELNNFKVGDRVRFTLKKSSDNSFVITDIKVLSP